MPWGLIIIALFVCAALGFGLPNIVTGSTAAEVMIQNNSWLFASAIMIVITVIAIFGSRH